MTVRSCGLGIAPPTQIQTGTFPGGGSYSCNASGCEITQAPDTPTAGFFPSGASYQCDANGDCTITQPPASDGGMFGLSQSSLLIVGAVVLVALVASR